jgi:hypothetical protein
MKIPTEFVFLFCGMLLVVLMLLSGGCDSIQGFSSEPTALQNSDHQIVPGKRIGPVALGMSDADLFKMLGPPSFGNPPTANSPGMYKWEYGNSYFSAEVDDGHQLIQLSLFDGTFHTSEGTGYGSTLQDLERVYGPPSKMTTYSFPPAQGAATSVSFDGKITFRFMGAHSTMANAPYNSVQGVTIPAY